MREDVFDDQTGRLEEVLASLDRNAAESMRLEILRLARRYGVSIKELRFDSTDVSIGDSDQNRA
jgi:hypothetical protein